MKGRKPLVTVDCTTYNHEKYIADAIESFLMQKTDFDIEILIHDDASTDRTAHIIKEYERKYPDLIKAICQTENQYSQGVAIELINFRRATGKYIALCEGDDYWTDPYKLQKQVDYMESHPECSLCIHAAYRVAADTKKIVASDRPSPGDKLFATSEIIQGGGRLFATNSMLYSTEKISEFPSFYVNAIVGDYPLAIYASLKGSVYYMDDYMSVYRVGVAGSWTNREFSTVAKRVEHFEGIAEMLDEINQYTHFQYAGAIEKAKKSNQFYLLMEQGKFKEAKTPEYEDFYAKAGYKKRIVAKIKYQFPRASHFLRTARWKMIQFTPRRSI